MDNQKLLKKYKIKLSIFFAFFVMFSLYLIETIFLGVQFISNNLNLENSLENKLTGIVNILKNKEVYYKQIESNDTTLQKIILKTLENSVIYKESQKVINFGEIENNILDKVGIINTNNKKYLIKNININNEKYKIILSIDNEYNLNFLLKQLLFFGIILSPFFLFFYFIGYFFVGRNFKVIEQTISSLEDFTANINHEMKTPISEIISTLELAKKVENYKEALEISLNSTYKLNKILDSITGIASLSDISYKRERIDLIKELNLIIKEFEVTIKEKNLEIKKDFANNSFTLKLNKEHFYLCIKNILSNAIKYSRNGGKIEILFKNGILEIKDYGIGIDKSNLKNVFNRYFRESYTSEQGFGLGLALVKKITDINKWKLEIESQKDAFTKIIINFI